MEYDDADLRKIRTEWLNMQVAMGEIREVVEARTGRDLPPRQPIERLVREQPAIALLTVIGSACLLTATTFYAWGKVFPARPVHVTVYVDGTEMRTQPTNVLPPR